MADNKSKTTTEVLDREDDLQIEDNFESPLEELDELGPTEKGQTKNLLKLVNKIERRDKKENQVGIS